MRVIVKHVIFLLLVSFSSLSQTTLSSFLKPSDTLNKQRHNTILISKASIAGVTLIGLNQLWYSEYDKSKFHTINDNKEWMQMDKLGHVFSSYQLSRLGAGLFNWSGAPKNNQLIYGATFGFGFLTAVEVFDGFSKEWGFSWGDVATNALGAGLFVGQELLWDEQRIAIKYSFHQTMYASQNPDKLGKSFNEQILKDYNGQTYWLSFNLQAFFKEKKFLPWLNIAVGYGAHGMLNGLKDIDNQMLTNNNRHRQFYISFDVNLENFNTNSRFLKLIFTAFNTIKVPFPTLEFSKNKCVFHPLYF